MSAAMRSGPVRVLMVLTVPFAKNGITGSVLNYVSWLDPARVRCDLVSPNEPDAASAALFERTGGQVFVFAGRNRNPLSYARRLSRLVRERGEEIVHAHGNSATLFTEMFAAKRGGAKVRMPHSHNTTCKMVLADRLLRHAFSKSFTQAMACSEAAGNWLFPNRPFEVLNNAVETARFRYDDRQRSALREALGLDRETLALLHIGTFNEQKNQAFLIGAFARMLSFRPDAVLLLVGEGGRQDACSALAKRLRLSNKVRFLGWRDDIPALLSAADAFVLPSLFEGLPLTLVEAQCAGLRCLASDRVTREAALTPLVTFHPIGDEAAFAEAIAGLPNGDRAAASSDAVDTVCAAGYDARSNAEWLMQRYEALAGAARKNGRRR